MATVVDLIGTAAIYTNVDSDQSEGVSVEINVSYLDAAFLDVNIIIFFFLFVLAKKRNIHISDFYYRKR